MGLEVFAARRRGAIPGAAALIAFVLAASPPAWAIDFHFSFGHVQGVIRGLAESGTSTPTSVEITQSGASGMSDGVSAYTGAGTFTVACRKIISGLWRGGLALNEVTFVLQLWTPGEPGSPPDTGAYLYRYQGPSGPFLWDWGQPGPSYYPVDWATTPDPNCHA
ncbi:MAG: hypothetical protein KDG55_02380 [Rhodocyclaceae bacterium]|nr:hypothetical protein [Rhodocyclaceae bacterium]